MEQKKAFILYAEYSDFFCEFSDEEAGRLIKSIFDYITTGAAAYFDDRALRMTYQKILNDLDRNAAKWEATKKARQEAGRRSAELRRIAMGLKKTEEQNEQKPAEDNKPEQKPKKKFIKPTLQEIESYCQERNNKVNALNFFNFYEAKGWKIGNSPMKDWKAAVRTWEQREMNKTVIGGGLQPERMEL